MNKLVKSIKRISAIATSSLLVSGAAFANLGNYPSNFVSSGSFDAKVVVGASAAASDTIAAQSLISDIKNDLSGANPQTEIVYRVNSEDGSSHSVSDSNDDLNLGEALNAALEKFKEEEMPSFLKDGVVSDENNEDKEYDYEQSIMLGDAKVAFGREYDIKEESDEPVFFLDVENSASLYTLKVDLGGLKIATPTPEDGEGLVDGEKITMFGREFTFDPNNKYNEDMKLFASSQTVVLDSEGKTTVSVNHEGKSFEVKLAGANSGTSQVQIVVNGDSETVKEGKTATIGGLKVYVDEVFVNDLTEAQKSASARLFLGSNEVVIPKSAATNNTIVASDFKDLEIDGKRVNGYKVAVRTGTDEDWRKVEEIQFRFKPQDMKNDDEVEYLTIGNSVVDPVFGELSVSFDAVSKSELMKNDKIGLEVSSDDLKVSLKNRDGKEVELEVYSTDGTNLKLHEDMHLSGALQDLTEDTIFLAQDSKSDSKAVSTFLRINSVEEGDDAGDPNVVTIENLATGKETKYEVGEKIDDVVDTNAKDLFIKSADPSGDGKVTISHTTNGGTAATPLTTFFTENDAKVTFSTITSNKATIKVKEDQDDNINEEDEITAAELVFDISLSAGDIKISSNGDTAKLAKNDEDADFRYGVTPMGTFFVEDIDEDESVMVYVPKEEVDFKVSFNVGNAGSTSTVKVNRDEADAKVKKLTDAGNTIVSRKDVASTSVSVDVSAPVLDSSVSGSSDMIVVGGPAVNSVARALLGSSEPGVEAGKAVIRYFGSQNSVLVYGYSAEGTQAAVRKLNAGGVSGTSVSVNE